MMIFPHMFVILMILSKWSEVKSDGETLDDQGYCEKRDDGSVDCESKQNIRLSRLEGVEIDHVTRINLEQENTLEMKTLSLKPVIFEIPNFLTEAECDHFINIAKEEGLKTSSTYKDPSGSTEIVLRDLNKDRQLDLNEMRITIEDSYDIYLNDEDIKKMYKDTQLDENNDELITPNELEKLTPDDFSKYLLDLTNKEPSKRSRMSKQVWLFPDTSNDKLFQDVQERVQKVTQLPMVLVKKSDFQVVNYGVQGHYNAHHDSSPINLKVKCCTRKRTENCRICRFMTILFYLNDVEEGGGTAFPVAGGEGYNNTEVKLEMKSNLQEHCNDAKLVVHPSKGKAVLWYSHFIDEENGWMGKLDLDTFHGGCAVTSGEKWIANFWIKATDSKEDDLKPGWT